VKEVQPTWRKADLITLEIGLKGLLLKKLRPPSALHRAGLGARATIAEFILEPMPTSGLALTAD
jgi:hypothetical protein